MNGVAGVYSHNKVCDAENWVGELELGGFEQYVLIDEVVELPPFEAYEEAIENFWPAFIEDSSI
ncbi:hypothetical protein FF3_01967 [Fretibacterium fastidiosum]|uniref:hypothetical protein n=1 Tax=Fretibacterium fastidiosum TaxID=651822 RepID=UPI0038FC4A71